MKTAPQLSGQLMTHLMQIERLLYDVSDMGEAAHLAGDTPLQHALEQVHTSIGKARTYVIDAISLTNTLPRK